MQFLVYCCCCCCCSCSCGNYPRYALKSYKNNCGKTIDNAKPQHQPQPQCGPCHNCLAWPFNCDKFYCRLCFQQSIFHKQHFPLVQVACAADYRLPIADCRVPCRGTNQLSFKLSNELSIILKDHVSLSNWASARFCRTRRSPQSDKLSAMHVWVCVFALRIPQNGSAG